MKKIKNFFKENSVVIVVIIVMIIVIVLVGDGILNNKF